MIILVMAISVNFVFAQGEEESSSVIKKEKRKAEADKEYRLTKQMLDNKDFVLESDFLQDRYGNRVFVNSTINFVAVDSVIAVIQIGSDRRLGPNGVGGVTAKGRISRWELKEDKRHNFTLSMNVMTAIGIYDLHLSVSPSGRATARLTGLRSGNLTFDGDLVPIEESNVYEGQSI
jgi:hypothetical protein